MAIHELYAWNITNKASLNFCPCFWKQKTTQKCSTTWKGLDPNKKHADYFPFLYQQYLDFWIFNWWKNHESNECSRTQRLPLWHDLDRLDEVSCWLLFWNSQILFQRRLSLLWSWILANIGSKPVWVVSWPQAHKTSYK